MAIANGYCTLAEVKAALRIADTADDSLLEVAVESASRAIDGYCGRHFYSAGTATRVYTPASSYVCYVDDLAAAPVSVKTSTMADGTWDITWSGSGDADYQLEPLNGVSAGLAVPYHRLRAVGDYTFPVVADEATVQVTAVFGWSTVPRAVMQACVIQASRLFKRLDSPLGVAGFGPDLGVIRVARGLDPDVQQLVDPYRRGWGVA